MIKKTIKAQSAVELALTLPFLFFIIFGVFDLGRIFYIKVIVINSARVGARYLTLNPTDMGSTPNYGETINATIIDATNSGVNVTNSDITPSCPDADSDSKCDSGEAAVVTVSQDVSLGIFGLFTGSYTLSSTAMLMVP